MFFIFLPNHDTCVKNKGAFSSWPYDGQKTLSFVPNSSLFGQKHIFKKNWP